MIKTAVVYGAGSWGTALAIQLAHRVPKVYLWGRDAIQIEAMQRERCNARYLPNCEWPPHLTAISEWTALNDVDLHLIVVPSHGFVDFLERLEPQITAQSVVMWASKGMDATSIHLFDEVFQRHVHQYRAFGVLSGPTFAKEVAQGLPTAMTIACKDLEMAKQLAVVFGGQQCRVYPSDDVIGVELGGAVKNVIAIAAGVSDGLNLGANARAAIVTRGLAEMTRLGTAMGAKPETMMGLSGLGDLMLTCTDSQSRNRRFGLLVGQGQSIEEAKSNINGAIEGIEAARSIGELARRYAIEMPISEQVHQVIFQGKQPTAAVQSLLSRDFKLEY